MFGVERSIAPHGWLVILLVFKGFHYDYPSFCQKCVVTIYGWLFQKTPVIDLDLSANMS